MAKLIAHRGTEVPMPENTLQSIQEMAKRGANWIEIDCQFTHDGKLVVIHDKSLERTTNGFGKLADIAYADLTKIDAGIKQGESFAGQRVPLLSEVLVLCRQLNLAVCIDLKEQGPRIVDEVARAIAAENPAEQSALYIYDEPTLEYAIKSDLPFAIFWGMGKKTVGKIEKRHLEIAKKREVGLTVEYTLLNKELIFDIKKQNIPLHIWTVNDKKVYDDFKVHNFVAILTDQFSKFSKT